MRLSKAEVARRKEAVLAYFRKNPTASVAKLNAVLKDGTLTGKPEKMLNIATGYKWRKEAGTITIRVEADKTLMPPELGGKGETVAEFAANTEAGRNYTAISKAADEAHIEVQTAVSPEAVDEVISCPGDGCPGCPGCHAPTDAPSETPRKRFSFYEE